MRVRIWRLGREVGAVDENIHQYVAGLGPTDVAQLRKDAFPGKSHSRRLHGTKLRNPGRQRERRDHDGRRNIHLRNVGIGCGADRLGGASGNSLLSSWNCGFAPATRGAPCRTSYV